MKQRQTMTNEQARESIAMDCSCHDHARKPLGLQACNNKLPVDIVVCVSLAVSCVRVNLPEFRRYFYCLISSGYKYHAY